MAPLVRRLLPDAEIVTRERFSNLTYSGSKKLTRLPRRSAVVAFSTDAVYAIAELIRRQRGGAAVVMGSLSPRTRNAQVALYQSGEVDFLVATDAIGMGLNMDVDHVAFAGLRKFDGKRTRWLYPQEVGQIAGRAGPLHPRRHLRGHRRLRGDGRGPGRERRRAPYLRAGHRGRVAQRPPRLRHAAGPAALAGRDAHRATACRCRPRRWTSAPCASWPARRTSSRAARPTARPCCGCGTSARRRTSARPPTTTTSAWPHPVRRPDHGPQAPARGLDRRPVQGAGPGRRRDRQPGRAALGRAHALLHRQPPRLAGQPRPLAGSDPAAGGPDQSTPCTRS
jgi:hypothetical protein